MGTRRSYEQVAPGHHRSEKFLFRPCERIFWGTCNREFKSGALVASILAAKKLCIFGSSHRILQKVPPFHRPLLYYSTQMISVAPSFAWFYILHFPLVINCEHFAQIKRFRWELIIIPAFCSHCLSFDWHYLLRQIKRDWKRAWWHHIFVPVCLNKVCFATRSCLVWPLLISLQPSPERVTTCFPFHPRPRYPPPIYISLICHSHHVNENLYIQFSLTSGRAFYIKNLQDEQM